MMILSLAPGRKKLIFVPLEKAAGQVECGGGEIRTCL